ncbi:hypothetical protein VNO80_08291 [Phaseolus coccineus]|uniref:Transaldolase n=1 Tax=Phaseolus coccineus TaxID=3886 RepID=A0AAN9NQA4_PHACN
MHREQFNDPLSQRVLLADVTEGTIEAAKWLHKVVDRPNVDIKIPATEACVPSIKEVIANGKLIFSLARYEAVIDAYLDGLKASGLNDLSRVTSVASFFVSRVDTLIDKNLEKIGTPEALNLRGKARLTNRKVTLGLFLKLHMVSGVSDDRGSPGVEDATALRGGGLIIGGACLGSTSANPPCP